MRYFHRKNKSPKKFQAFSWNFFKKLQISRVGGNWPRCDSNTQPSDLESDAQSLRHELLEIFEPYGWKIGLFFLPVFIFLVLNVPIFPWIDTVLLETNKTLIKLTGFFLNFFKKKLRKF